MTELRNVRKVEARDPRAATQQLYYIGRDQAQVPQWDPARAIRHAYDSVWPVRACIDAMAEDLAGLPVRAGVNPDDPATDDPTCHLAMLFGRRAGQSPNPEKSAEELFKTFLVDYLCTGQGALDISDVDAQGRPARIYNLPASSLKAVPSDSGPRMFKRFSFGRPDKPISLEPDQIVYAWESDPKDPRQATSPLQAARFDISTHEAMGRYSYAFYMNGAVPATLVIVPQFGSKEDFERWKVEWNANFAGPDNSGRTFFKEADLSEGSSPDSVVHVEQLGTTAKDARQIDHNEYLNKAICSALGVPYARIDTSGETFSNAGEALRIYWRKLQGIARRVDGAINRDLAPRLGREVIWHDFTEVDVLATKPEPTTAKVGAPSLVQAGIMTFNEARAEYGLPPIQGGDRLLTAEEAAQWQTGPAEGLAVATETRKPEPDVRELEAVPETTEVDHEERRARIWRSADAAVRSLEKRWERAWSKLFNRQAKSALAALEGKRGHKLAERRDTNPDAVFNPNYWRDETRDLAADLYEAVVAQGFARVSSSFGISFDLGAEDVDQFIQARANQLAGQVTDTTYAAIQDALVEGINEGDGIPELSRRIREVFETASSSRATTIARTEVISAYNGSALLGASQLPDDVAAGQEWIATRDDRVREEHLDADGQIRGIGETFDVGGTPMAYPGDPAGDPSLTVNCRCTIAILTPDEYQAALSEGRARTVEVRLTTAQALIGLPFDERRWRAVMRSAA